MLILSVVFVALAVIFQGACVAERPAERGKAHAGPPNPPPYGLDLSPRSPSV